MEDEIKVDVTPRTIVHADGGECHGTPLINGICPKCGLIPDMQSTEIWNVDNHPN